MTQDCLDSLSAASAGKRLPKGINITGTDGKPASGIEGVPWGYMFLHNKTAPIFEREMRMYNDMHPDSAHACSFTARSRTGKRTRMGEAVRKPIRIVNS